MDASREEVYSRAAGEIGRTPLYEIRHLEIPYGNRVFAKEEYRNPTGSHYDRVFLRVLYGLEREGKIRPGQELVETTSGNAGASFAWLCKVLEYRATILIPEDMPHSRVAQIKSYGADVVLTPRGKYVVGVIEQLRSYLRERKSRGDPVYCTNHAESRYSAEGMEEAGREIIKDLMEAGVDKVDVHVSALGGGVSLRGIGAVLGERWPDLRLVGVEPFEAPDNYIRRFPGRFESTYGFEPRLGPHGLLGIGRWGDTSYRWPHMEAMLQQIADILLVRPDAWQDMSEKLRDLEGKHVGRTSAACVCAALEIAKAVREQVFVVVFYDPAWKYLDSM